MFDEENNALKEYIHVNQILIELKIEKNNWLIVGCFKFNGKYGINIRDENKFNNYQN